MAVLTSHTTGNAVLGIDLGTSSVKALVTDSDGRVLGQARVEYPVVAAQPGWSESDPRLWLSATSDAVRKAVASVGRDIVGIGLSGQMHGVVVTDELGRPLRPAMLWSDARAERQLGAYRHLPQRVRARLANPLSPGMAGPMLRWLAEQEPQTYARARWALQPKDWLRHCLTGRFATEPSDASATLLYDLQADDWDTELLELLELRPGLLPPILATSGSHAGELTSTAARLLELSPGLPTAAGAADTAAAALGSALYSEDSAQLTVGTGAQIVRPLGNLPVEPPDGPVTQTYRAATDRGWYAMAAVLNGGSALGWVCRVLDAGWQDLYASAATAPTLDDPVFLPHINGERTPHLDSRMRGAWTGLGPQHDRSHLLRSALEGVAFAVREGLDTLVTPGSLTTLRLAGGGTTDPYWRQMLCDITGFPLEAVEVDAASALGAAALGARTAGLVDEAGLRRDWAPSTCLVAEPRPTLAAMYESRYELFRVRLEGLRTADDPS